MKKALTFSLSFIFLFTITMQAQIIHYDYGDGLAYSLNESSTFDFDENGVADLIINSQDGRLGITPIFYEGCVVAYEGYNSEIEGVRIRVLQEGASIQYGNGSMMYFEEEEPLPLYGDGNTYTDWEDGEAKYIGFLSFNTLGPGWMKIRVDTEAEKLYILSYAYLPEAYAEILAGETPEGTVGISEMENLSELNVFPNPVNDLLKIDLQLTESSKVEFTLKTMNGKQVRMEKRELNTGFHQERMDVANLANGIYQLVIQSNGAYISKSITIAR